MLMPEPLVTTRFFHSTHGMAVVRLAPGLRGAFRFEGGEKTGEFRANVLAEARSNGETGDKNPDGHLRDGPEAHLNDVVGYVGAAEELEGIAGADDGC